MKLLLGYYCVLCIFLVKVESKPQITKLFPVKELAEFHERTNEIKPLDKFIGKLRATYNFVFNKPEDTSNVEKILSKDASAPNPDVEALKLILANVISPRQDTASKDKKGSELFEARGFETGNEKQNSISLNNEKTSDSDKTVKKEEKDDWLDGIEAPKPSSELELQDDDINEDGIIETTPSTFQLPMALGQQLLDWLGALLTLTCGAYSRVAQAVKT